MEFVETPTFWCPHVDPTACSNFSPRTVEPRPPESREIFPFPFSSFSFSSLFSLRILFFLFLFFFPFFPFCFSILFSFLLSFSPFLFHFLSLFGTYHSFGQRRKFPPLFLKPFVWPSNFPLYSLYHYFLFMTSSTTWLNVSHGIPFPHMAHCEPFFQVDHMALPSVTLLGCHVASPNLAMCHLTPHTSKNVKSRPPRNPTKFEVVAKFRETISTEKSV